MLGEYLGDQAD